MPHDLSESPQTGVPANLAVDMSISEQTEWIQAYLRRHQVTRRAALVGSAGSLGVLALAASPFGAQAVAATRDRAAAAGTTGSHTIGGRHLGLGADPSTSMWVSGELFDLTGIRVAPGSLKAVVQYGTSTHYGASKKAEFRELLSQVPVNGGGIFTLDQFFVHAELTGLKPGTKYHYRFKLSDGSVTGDGTFTTAGTNGKAFTFTAFGDQGVNYDAAPVKPSTAKGVATSDYYSAADWTTGGAPTATTGDPTKLSRSETVPNRSAAPAASLTKIVKAKNASFHLMCGDIAYADPSGTGAPDEYPVPTQASGFNAYDPSIWTAYFSQIEGTASHTPWMAATGNHDMEALYDGNASDTGSHGYHGHAQRLNLLGGKAHGTPGPSIYSFRFQNVAAIAVDCNDLSDEITVNRGYTGGAQAKWLEKTLKKYRLDPTIDFIFAWHHHCAFATANAHHSDGGVRSVLGPLFHKYQVDAVFQGHNHQYERTDPLKHTGTGGYAKGISAPDKSTINGWKGTSYLTVGSGGRPRYSFDPTTAGAVTERFRGNPNGNGPETIASGYFDLVNGTSQFVKQDVNWSQARYADYAVAVVDVEPAHKGKKTSFTIHTINDLGIEIDRVTFTRIAGTGPKIKGLSAKDELWTP